MCSLRRALEWRQRRPRSVLIAASVVGAGLVGCANFEAASDFAAATAKMTAVVRDEIGTADAICRQQAELVIVVVDSEDEAPLQACKAHQVAEGRLATATLDVLDAYAKALAALADGKSLDLSADIDGLASKPAALKDKAGDSLVTPAQAGAVTKVAELIAQVATMTRREQAIKQLVAEAPDVAATGALLKSYFVGRAASAAKAPYANLMALSASSIDATETLLRRSPLRKAEPIRTLELYRDMRSRKELVQARMGAPGEVPAKIVAAIDAWLQALDAFAAHALKPDAKELYAQLKNLREKAAAARLAVNGQTG